MKFSTVCRVEHCMVARLPVNLCAALFKKTQLDTL
jgi:hypothetical protein